MNNKFIFNFTYIFEKIYNIHESLIINLIHANQIPKFYFIGSSLPQSNN
jgi:hypothetical protein